MHAKSFQSGWTRCNAMNQAMNQCYEPVHQAFLSMGFSGQEYWSGLPCPPPRDLPDPGIKPTSLKAYALAGRFFTTSATSEAQLREPKGEGKVPEACNIWKPLSLLDLKGYVEKPEAGVLN